MQRLIRFALGRAGLVVLLTGILFIAGVAAFTNLNIEAYPDPVPPLVEIVTQSQGQSAEEIERYVTIPIEVQMAGIPHVTAVRSISLFGLSDVKIQFTYDFTFQEAEQRVINRLAQLPQLPNGAQPQLSPESPIGEVYRYRLAGPPGYSVQDLKTLQDWVLQRRLKSVPGVIDVTGWGGTEKTYEVVIDRDKLTSFGVPLAQVLTAIGAAGSNVGGQTVNIGEQAAIVRGVGLLQGLDQLRAVSLRAANGTPVLLSDVAAVRIGHQPRLGIAGQDRDGDVVEGIVLMQRGAESLPTIKGIEAEVARINSQGLLPPGVHIVTAYNRAQLIGLTTSTVLHNLVAGVLLIFAIQWVFLGNLRTAAIVAATIPFALAFALLILTARGESANLLSVGAIDFGLIVDATVIMIENIYRHLAERHDAPGRTKTPANVYEAMADRFEVIAGAAREVDSAIFFAAAIIVVSFLPLFTLTGVEGHIFGPMARTYAYAILGGLIATFTATPALSYLLLKGPVEERETWVVRHLRRVFEPILARAVRFRLATMGITAGLLALTLLAGSQLGVEFLPKLEEGNFWIRATMPTAISLEAGTPAVDGIRQVIGRFPEVQTVISQHGRPDDGTDATGFFNAEFFVPLRPFGDWPAGVTKESLTAQLQQALGDRFPGVEFNFSQTIEDNVEEAASGVKGANSVKLFGNDLNTLQATARKMRDAIAGVPGIADLAVSDALGQPTVRIDIDRARAARFGLNTGDINTVIQTAVGGAPASVNVFEPGSDRNFPIIVRLVPEQRGSIDAIGRIPVIIPAAAGTGTTAVPLADLATIRLVSGASFIYREGQERYVPIEFSVRGRDLGGTIADAQAAVARRVAIPPGYRAEWVGELSSLHDAVARLEVVVPVSLALIALLLFLHFGSAAQMAIAFSVIPTAVIGGVLALAITGTPFSISAAIGFIALFGIAVTGGLIVVGAFNRATARGGVPVDAALQAGTTQFRAVSMTCVAAAVGLLPAAVSTGIGSQVQRPLAIVVVGGVSLAPLFILLLVPALLAQFSRARPCARAGDRMKALAPALALLASGCVVGPRYHTPAPPAATGFTPEPPVLSAPGAPAQTVTARPIPANWWRAFGSAKLDALVSEALAHSPTIAAARAALRQAHEQQLAVNGQLLPQLEVNPNYQRGKQSNELQPPINGGSQSYSIVTAGAQVTFNPDVFGGLRSARAQSRAQADVARAELAAARLTVLGNVVAQAVLHAGLTAQLAEQARIITDYERTVAIGREQQREGQISGADLAAFQAQLASARGALPPLDRARVLARDQLAVLTGHTPDQAAGRSADARRTPPANGPAPGRAVNARGGTPRYSAGRGQHPCGDRPGRRRAGRPATAVQHHRGRWRRGASVSARVPER